MANPIHSIRTRLRPSTIIATAALVAALGGTAYAAGEIITSPEQLKDGVVTSQKIPRESVSNLRLKDPQLKLRVRGNGTSNGAGDGSVVRAPGAPKGTYDVTFDQPVLNGGKDGSDTVVTENCAVTATARSAAAPPSTALDVAPVMFAMRTIGPNTVRVFTAAPDGTGTRPVDTSFDIMASC